jgi:hypothetical protein
MRESLELIHDHAGLLETCTALDAVGSVGPERCHAESDLAIEEQIDLVGKKMPMIHNASEGAYGAVAGLVSCVR